MYSHTSKVGSTGRYGPRAGRKAREGVRKIEDAAKNAKCPSCGSPRVKKSSVGVWACGRCERVFAAAAFTTESSKKKSEEETS